MYVDEKEILELKAESNFETFYAEIPRCEFNVQKLFTGKNAFLTAENLTPGPGLACMF